MEVFNSYGFIIGASVIIIVSYFFSLIAKRTNIPSVLLLILLGILIKQGMDVTGYSDLNLFPLLEVLGIVGLIMIVLEAALDLELKKEKWPIIWKSFCIALVSLGGSSYLIALIIQSFIPMDLFTALLYSIPLSIMSSAIVIPSVANLSNQKKEFMIYESTFSDILGIMFFYFLLESVNANGAKEIGMNIVGNISLTIIISILVSYILVFVFQNIKTETKLFLLIAVLLLLYALGKLSHLSSLLIILVFGLVLQNRHIFFRGFLRKYLKEDAIKEVFLNFKVITLETSFVVRTFFFVIFGITISLTSLLDFRVFLISIMILAVLYSIRFITMKIFLRRNIFPQLYLAPRGLITILLFFAIPSEFLVPEFETGILLFVIIMTSIIMAMALIRNGKAEKNKEEDIEVAQEDDIK